MLQLSTNEMVVMPSEHDVTVLPPEECLSETAFRLCRDYLHGTWRHIQMSQMVFRKVSGGLSNLLYCCELTDDVITTRDEPRKVLVRIYGQVNRERALENLITECVILTLLSERQRGPRLYGVFPGGRIEEYIPARPLLTRELAHPKLSNIIAEKMAQIHVMDVPMNKRPKRMWETVERWLSTIEDLIEQEEPPKQMTDMINKIRQLGLRREVAWLQEFLSRIYSPVVFCHNDMQEGNILLREDRSKAATNNNDGMKCQNSISSGESETEKQESVDKNIDEFENITSNDIVIIDFEYCGYNNRGFDLANHLIEWMYDYTNEEPPYFWARPVEEHATYSQKVRLVETYLNTYMSAKDYQPKPEDTVAHILEETDYYQLASHFFWALWSVINNSTMSVHKFTDFDYWGYGEARFEAYYKHKEKMLLKSQKENAGI